MTNVKTTLAAVGATVLAAAAVAVGWVGIRVHHVLRPPVDAGQVGRATSVLVDFERVAFEATDGTRVAAWFFEGERTGRPIVLCHDLGSSKRSLMALAMSLQDAGFPVLAVDLRGHGESGGELSGLGLLEKRDVIGAASWLAAHYGPDVPLAIGVYGVGVGAQAAVLAARERPSIRALVLDDLQPDAGETLLEGTFGRVGLLRQYLGGIARRWFELETRVSLEGDRAEEALGELRGRHVLLLAPAGDARAAARVEALYRVMPDAIDTDGNLTVVGRSGPERLYGETLRDYHEKVLAFLSDRLGT